MGLTRGQTGAIAGAGLVPFPLTTLMKCIFLFTCLLLLSAAVCSCSGSSRPPPSGPTPQELAKIAQLETQVSEQHKITDRWQLAAGIVGILCVLLFVTGTALGAEARKTHGKQKSERNTAAFDSARDELDDEDPPDGRPRMAP